ncbi:hypothetical protein AB1Y20_012345 [Prymnesium parvum]|uniref:Fe2OG dioxygenase domain-containing protein n=1 Tax=Prymnesium parvum TaxID=97485 RepID=A0AB34IR40_PRYPA
MKPAERAWGRSRWRPPRRALLPLQLLTMADLETPSGGAALLRALQRDGLALLRAPPPLAPAVSRCLAVCRDFFALPAAEKARHGAGPGSGQQHGYMSMLDDGGSECLELKLCHDAAFEWPPRLQRAAAAAVRALLGAARRALEAVAAALGMRRAYVAALLDDAGASVRLEEASHSAARVWCYTRGVRSGWHADNTLLTVAPRGTAVGLRCRLLDGRRASTPRECVYPEKLMEPDQLVVFAGDALSYLSGGRVPALVHEVIPPVCNDHPRLSMPFFLRARRAAVLEPQAASPHITDPRVRSLPPLRVSDLEANVRNVRMSWFWKQDGMGYYDCCEWHPDEK